MVTALVLAAGGFGVYGVTIEPEAVEAPVSDQAQREEVEPVEPRTVRSDEVLGSGAPSTKPIEHESEHGPELLTVADIEATATAVGKEIGRVPSSVVCDDFIMCDVRYDLEGEDPDYLETLIIDGLTEHHTGGQMIPRHLRLDDQITVYLMRRGTSLEEIGDYIDVAAAEHLDRTGEIWP